MTLHISIPINDASVERARKEAEARGLSLEAYFAQLIEASLPPERAAAHGDVSSIFGLVQDGEPTDIAKDKDRLIGEAVWQEHQRETRQK